MSTSSMIDEALILDTAKAHYAVASKLPMPPLIEIDHGWREFQQRAGNDISQFRSVREAISYAQCQTSFNHRGPVSEHQIKDKLDLLNLSHPELDFMASPYVESPYSKPDTVCNYKGKMVSNILFWHLYPQLTAMKWLTVEPRRLLEIGGGCGEMARLWKLGHPSIHWLDIDLPESLFFAEVFLRCNFPDSSFHYLESYLPVSADDAEFVFVPLPLYPATSAGTYDVAFNQGSMQEMSEATIACWIRFLQGLRLDAFYSLNYKRTLFHWPKDWVLVHEDADPKVITYDSAVDYETCWRLPKHG